MHLDLYADVVCPWCRIGKKNLFDALDLWRSNGGEPVTVSYRAYLLDPSLPAEGLPFSDAMLRKVGDAGTLKQMVDHVTQAGAAAGVNFHFDLITRMPNTLLAHRFVAILPGELKASAMDALYRAYFEEGRDVAQMEEIAAIADAIGADRADVTARLLDGEGSDAVMNDLDQARRMGIQGVPFFVFNNRYALSGAYPADKIVQLMGRVLESENQSEQER